MDSECHRVVDGGAATSTKSGGTFFCRGCYRICPANPRLKPGTQEYCSRRSCQRLRMDRWDKARLKADPEYREQRRKTKADSRRRCAANEATRRRQKQAQERAQPPPTNLPDPTPVTPAASGPSEPVCLELQIRPGLFLIRPAEAPASETKAVEIAAVWSDPALTIEHFASAVETDAFLLRRSAPQAAQKEVR